MDRRKARRDLITFFALAYGITFGLSVPELIEQLRNPTTSSGPQGSSLLTTVGMFGPAVAAVLVSAATGGWKSALSLITRLGQVRARFPWPLVALLFCPTVAFVGIGAFLLIFGRPEGMAFGGLPMMLMMFSIILIIVPCEEIGWRGFALPRLQSMMGALPAALLLGLLWGPWHLAIAVVEPWRQMGNSLFVHIALFTFFTMALSVVFTWVFNNTGGSLFYACVVHASMNSTGPFASLTVPESHLQYQVPMGVAIYTLVAAALVWRFGGRDLSRRCSRFTGVEQVSNDSVQVQSVAASVAR